MSKHTVLQFKDEIFTLFNTFRGQGIFRSKILWLPEQSEIRIMPADRSGTEPVGMLRIMLQEDISLSWYFQPPRERHREFRYDYADTESWLKKALILSNGKNPFLSTHP